MHKQYDCSVCLYSVIMHPKQYLHNTNNMCVLPTLFVKARCALLYQKVFNLSLNLKKCQIVFNLVKQSAILCPLIFSEELQYIGQNCSRARKRNSVKMVRNFVFTTGSRNYFKKYIDKLY